MTKSHQGFAPVNSLPQSLESLIHVIRGRRVMFDADLAALYSVPTKALNQALRRNLERFPEDFAFQLSTEDLVNWRSQIVTSNPSARMGLRRPPYVFTQEGIAMLSSVLRSERAIQMNIAIMRTFVRMRELMAAHKDIAARVEKLERGQERAASVIEVLVEDIDRLGRKIEKVRASEPPYARQRIGYITDNDQIAGRNR
jgi:ORF6N domain